MRLCLWDLQSPINIGMILRTAEIYRVPVVIYDRRGVFGGSSALTTISDFACGALQRQPPSIYGDEDLVREAVAGRLFATVITPDAQPLQQTMIGANDCVLVGNEYDGLPDRLLASVDTHLMIPMPPGYYPKPSSASPIDPARSHKNAQDGMPSLNVAVASAIIMFEVFARTPGAGITAVRSAEPRARSH
ncbi:TrmH family RNA methyltransferase [Mesorhizobium comanense]|uniref:TrmH family RNA methyltransferase n=1 Tax=Mesorhizobium comanense TaxID=2502215 RepID=UPI0010F76EF8|nr:TrmH family RNA methyltransferase [Mesorhizobium comanense]